MTFFIQQVKVQPHRDIIMLPGHCCNAITHVQKGKLKVFLAFGDMNLEFILIHFEALLMCKVSMFVNSYDCLDRHG